MLWTDQWHGKKGGVNLVKTRGEFTQNVAFASIYWCSPVGKSEVFQLFCCRWIWVLVALSGIFPLRWIPENACFLEFTSLLIVGKSLVCLSSQMFSRCKTSRSPGVYNWKPNFPLFSRTENAVKFRKTHYLPEFTARLTYGKNSVFPRSQKFSPVFLYFPRMANSREF